MNMERVERAIQILKRVPDSKFDLNTWAMFTREEVTQIKLGRLRPALNGCGTAGCAMGWIASDPRCMEEGLHLELRSDVWKTGGIRFGEHREFPAAAAYFSVPYIIALWLFDPEKYEDAGIDFPSRVLVIQRLELLLAAGERTFLDMMYHEEKDA